MARVSGQPNRAEDHRQIRAVEIFPLCARAQDKCRVRIERLRDLGHELRRPEADYLRDGIYELRVGLQGMNYRLLYFFHGRVAAVLVHGLVKEREVPRRDIEEAIRRKRKFELDPERHTYKES
jgi:phage-related protein